MNANTRFLNPETLFVPPGYTQIVETTGPSRTVYIAGQLGIDKDGRLPGDFRSQAIQTFENLKEALAAVGGKLEHIVKLNNYLLDIQYLPVIRDVRAKYLGSEAPPASTTLQVAGFARIGALLEIEAVAVLPMAKATRSARPAAKAAKPAKAKTAKAPARPAAKKKAAPQKKPAKKKR
jgi:enamine deaminase RidA (YjgF/YER057c/UK114 family)